jgi:hypothetical protein
MRKSLDITGMKFGKLTALHISGRHMSPSRKHIMWLCVCDCGNHINVRLNNLRSGGTVSCGCKKLEGNSNRKHSKTGTTEYRAWAHMKARCSNPNHVDFHNYGGRGIKVCQRWSESFEAFLEDMGQRPSDMTSIDRIDVNGDYSKDNCRWANAYIQSRNKRTNRYYSLNGIELCLSDWATKLGIGVPSLMERLRNWPIEKALTTLKENQN